MSATDVQALLVSHAPSAPERLRARVAELAPAPRSRSRRLVLVVVPVAVALAVAAAIVHGIVGSGTKTVQPGVLTGVARAKAPSVGAGAPTFSAGGARLQHTDASLEIQVDEARLAAATQEATRIATTLGGYAQSVSYSTPGQFGGQADLELRVPARNVRVAVTRLTELGTLVSQQLSVTDLQQELDLERASIAQQRRTIAALEQALKDQALPAAQRVLLQIRLAEERRALSDRLQARNGTVASGAIANVSVVLETKSALVPFGHHRSRLGQMAHDSLNFLAAEATFVLEALIVLAPLVVIAVLLWTLRNAKRRRDERLVME
ncbi:MAG TPA: DUF4349 domain-containing protein [Gaiellaceae bacterium]|nr:DUF4349 domain-containing protein [Gaiellaceae bacterium]